MVNTSSWPSFKRAYVVSDLHLGGDTDFQMFSEGSAFQRFCETIAGSVSKAKPTVLIINGDFVDFLAERKATYWNGDTAEGMLQRIASCEELEPVFEGLKSFVAKEGARLVLTLGNHDLELVRGNVRDALVSRLTNGDADSKARIEFAFDGWGYRFLVGNRTALAIHGNEVDEYNFTRYDVLTQIIREEQLFGDSIAARGWRPSAGTVFVVNGLNQLKERFPFVDLLKPEMLVFLSLSILAPQSIRFIDEALEMKTTAFRNERNRPSSERRFLGDVGLGAAEPVAQSPARISTEAKRFYIEERALRFLRDPDPRRIDEFIHSTDDLLLGAPDWYRRAEAAVSHLFENGVQIVDSARQWVGDRLSESAKQAHANALRTALAPSLAETSFRTDALDKFDQKLLGMLRGDYDVVFAGHTHIRRFVERPNKPDTFYVNTGTWAGVMRLFADDVDNLQNFRPVYDLMMSDKRSQLVESKWVRQERPVAILETDNAKKVKLRLARVGDQGEIQDTDLDNLDLKSSW